MKQIKWCKLGEIATIKTGDVITKNFIKDNPGEYPVINSGMQPLGFVNVFNTENDPIGITSRGAGVGSVLYTSGKYFRGSLNYSVTIKEPELLMPRFVYFYLCTFERKIQKLVLRGAIPALNASDLKELKVPLPPMDEQARIVKILDTFEALLSNLNTELTQRIKQMRYYAEQLLNPANMSAANWCKLGDVVLSISTGLNPRKNFVLNQSNDGSELDCWYATIKDYSANERLCFEEGKTNKITQSIRALINKRSKLEKDDILLAGVGATVGRVAIVDTEPTNFDISESSFAIKANQKIINPKFLMYLLRSSYLQDKIMSNLHSGTMPGIRKETLVTFEIPIPPMDEQARIVKILDTFGALIDNIRTEINQRTKQARFYKEQLLNFEQS